MQGSDTHFMQLAIEQAHLSPPVGTAYCVGAVAVDHEGRVIATGYSREHPGNTHAEEVVLRKLGVFVGTGDGRLGGMGITVYTTMEPCGQRLSARLPCAERLSKANLSRVVVGAREPSLFIKDCIGTDHLRAHGVTVDYLVGLEEAALAPNAHLFAK
ncbi:putative deaminase [Chytriomyces cf. hyalinus JEL632]|nr:putative deaminase [Chytriomyces cf. hyalinus JEL632]